MQLLKRYQTEVLIFLVLLLCYAYFLPRWADWNQNSRIDLVLAIVDQGTLSIDAYYHNTGDYAVFNGRYYSDKAPGTAFLGAPVYAAARPLLHSAPVQRLLSRLARSDAFGATLREDGSRLLADKIYVAVVLYLVTVTVVAIPAALLGVLIYRFLEIFALPSAWRAIIALLYGLATNAFPYSGAFFSHQVVAFLLFGAFYLSFLIGRGSLPIGWIALAGFMLGFAVITEYPAALIAGALFVYALLALPNRRWAAGLILGGLPPGVALMAYDWAIFGNVLPIGYEHSELYSDIHGQGFISLVGPTAPALWGITFSSYRGIFFVAPILLLGIPGFVAWWRRRSYRIEWGICAWAVASFLLFNGSTIMWQGGFSIGPRYLLPMLPFMTMAIGAFVAAWGARRWARALVGGLGAWSFAVVWAQTIGGQSFPDWTPNPLFNYSLPHLAAGNIARNLGMALDLHGWASLLPLGVAVLALIAILVRRLRLERSEQPAGFAPAQRKFGNEVAQP
jgi:hypothetical protein